MKEGLPPSALLVNSHFVLLSDIRSHKEPVFPNMKLAKDMQPDEIRARYMFPDWHANRYTLIGFS